MALREFLPRQILAHARASGVDRIVLIQMSYYGTDNQYMLDVIAESPDIFRGVAIIDPRMKAVEEEMKRLAGKGARGFRITITSPEAAARLSEGAFDVMFRQGAALGLAICPLINPEFLPVLEKVVARFPETPVIVDHLARLGISGEIRQEDVNQLCYLSQYPEVRVKVSAFYALGQKQPPHLDLAPTIKQVFEAYGPQRLMWASDCPFQILNEPYEASIALIREHLDFLSAEDREWILRKTAEEFFFKRG